MECRTGGRRGFPSTRTLTQGGNLTNLTRHAIAAGLVALSLGAAATPAMAKGGGDGGGDINNTVVTFAPDLAPAPTTTSGGGSGKGGTNRPSTCVAVGVDPITGSIIMSCTQNRV
jgi:hypothetical protein